MLPVPQYQHHYAIYSYFVEQQTRASQKPDEPHFTWETFPKENGYSNVRVIWHPNLNGNPGNHFFVKYKLKGETIALQSAEEYLTNIIEVSESKANENHF